jgi:protein transport protein SEC23
MFFIFLIFILIISLLMISLGGISDANLPAELLTEATTIEYRPPVQQTAAPSKPIFLFVVDVSCKHEDEIAALRKALLRALDVIPPEALVGFITFGATVCLDC